ncbi:MAG: dephospho-CoA kinase [Microcoleus sp. CSU_2_2]|nr:dephospho-CoA kinase [Microcoleus sp. SU_5_3]NJS11128.1 dephospho-CoA kinase [Microcoleus sp. CSU_2_2]
MSDRRIARIIGLTGGIATGKTAISNYLADTYGFPILDADIYAREAVHPGSPILDSIVERYGASILLVDGNLNRPELGNIIFCNPAERQWLEEQIHPYVRRRLVETTQSYISQLSLVSTNALTVVLVVPLLFEAKMTDLCTEIWVVYCSPSVQLERLMQRDGLNIDRANARINTQLPIGEKCQKADRVLDNSSTLDSLFAQIQRIPDL